LLSDIKKVLKKNGLFICSGISEENQNTVIMKMKEKGFTIIEVLIKEKWVVIVGKLKNPNKDRTL
jgi:ribosomal protein L11 methyltransferase